MAVEQWPLFALAILALVLIPFVPNLVRLRIRFLLERVFKLHEMRKYATTPF